MMTVATTGVARYVSYVMPDDFAAWIVLGGLLVIFARRRLERAIAGLTIVLSVVVHNSNLPLGIAFGVVVLGTTACLRPSIDVRRLRDLLAVLVLGAATAAVMNWALGAGFTLSRGAPTFMVNRLAAAGVVSQRLETYCPQVGWQLCTSQQVIRQPHTDAGWWFLWGDDSPYARWAGNRVAASKATWFVTRSNVAWARSCTPTPSQAGSSNSSSPEPGCTATGN